MAKMVSDTNYLTGMSLKSGERDRHARLGEGHRAANRYDPVLGDRRTREIEAEVAAARLGEDGHALGGDLRGDGPASLRPAQDQVEGVLAADLQDESDLLERC